MLTQMLRPYELTRHSHAPEELGVRQVPNARVVDAEPPQPVSVP